MDTTTTIPTNRTITIPRVEEIMMGIREEGREEEEEEEMEAVEVAMGETVTTGPQGSREVSRVGTPSPNLTSHMTAPTTILTPTSSCIILNLTLTPTLIPFLIILVQTCTSLIINMEEDGTADNDAEASEGSSSDN